MPTLHFNRHVFCNTHDSKQPSEADIEWAKEEMKKALTAAEELERKKPLWEVVYYRHIPTSKSIGKTVKIDYHSKKWGTAQKDIDNAEYDIYSIKTRGFIVSIGDTVGLCDASTYNSLKIHGFEADSRVEGGLFIVGNTGGSTYSVSVGHLRTLIVLGEAEEPAMSIEEKSLRAFEHVLDTIPKEEMDAIVAKIDAMPKVGCTIEEYVKKLSGDGKHEEGFKWFSEGWNAGHSAAIKLTQQEQDVWTEKDMHAAFAFYHFAPFPHQVSFSEWLDEYKENKSSLTWKY